jgi:hypothetical protein
MLIGFGLFVHAAHLVVKGTLWCLSVVALLLLYCFTTRRRRLWGFTCHLPSSAHVLPFSSTPPPLFTISQTCPLRTERDRERLSHDVVATPVPLQAAAEVGAALLVLVLTFARGIKLKTVFAGPGDR